ncbi:MAG TPA: GNAT family N-acetyltransferase [Pseudonocardiaceae bacterium]|jgi:predicted acetyltransferase|nr:GNAT family N-acetyltransferase [Pseudonocardiaceae bacterium]
MPELVLPDVAIQRSFLAAMAEFRAEGRGAEDDLSMIGNELRGFSATWDSEGGFADYLAALRADADPDHPRPADRVACTSWWWVEGTEYLGRIAVRHRLTDCLRVAGGHIGYDIRPTARRSGHATAMLRAVLPEALALGVKPAALVTIDPDNVGSRKATEANGGVLEDVGGPFGLCRYWIPTS